MSFWKAYKAAMRLQKIAKLIAKQQACNDKRAALKEKARALQDQREAMERGEQ